MKISISTLPFRHWEFDEVVQCCSSAGYDAVEIRMNFHTWSMVDLSNEHYEAIASKLKENGLSVVGLGSGVIIPTYVEKDKTEMKRLFEIANILGAKGVRIMLGYVRNFVDEPVQPIYKEELYKWLLEVDEMAGEMGKEVWIETHNEYATGESLHQLYVDMNLKHTKIIWDILHPIEDDESVEDTMGYLYDHLAHMHIKDGVSWNDPNKLLWKYTPVGEGDVPIQKIVHMLEAAGYDGFYSLEWESSWRKELEELNRDAEEIAAYPEYMRSLSGL